MTPCTDGCDRVYRGMYRGVWPCVQECLWVCRLQSVSSAEVAGQ